MIEVVPSVVVESGKPKDEMYRSIEAIGRTCYKSEPKAVSADASAKFIQRLIASGHESVIEHESIRVRMIIDRGVSHELVRHRIASYTQESTRYCNYSSEKFGTQISVIRPCLLDPHSEEYYTWYRAMVAAQHAYMELTNNKIAPQIARSVLPTCLKTEVVVTMNLREWRHFFKLRCAKEAHPDMRYIATLTINQFKERWPEIFADINADMETSGLY